MVLHSLEVRSDTILLRQDDAINGIDIFYLKITIRTIKGCTRVLPVFSNIKHDNRYDDK
jgi:hypothetical protein